MTWGELKKLVDDTEGVTDDSEIAWVDVGSDNIEYVSITVVNGRLQIIE